MNIKGSWTGTIVYGKEYRKFKNKELYFDMELSQQDNLIIGTSKDVGGVGMNSEIANIKGTLKGVKLEFIKQYNTFHYYKNGEVFEDKTSKGLEINYSGVYNENELKFTGSWVMIGKINLFGFIPIKYKNTGTWSMKRK